MTIILTIIHVIVALFLIVVVLLQTGKRADLAGAFGGGGSQTAFGTRGAATILSKATTAAAVMFMITSMGLSILSARSRSDGGSVLDQVETPAQTAPAPTPEVDSELPALPPLPDEQSDTEESSPADESELP
jgi:preprotein translocase subunit SecG